VLDKRELNQGEPAVCLTTNGCNSEKFTNSKAKNRWPENHQRKPIQELKQGSGQLKGSSRSWTHLNYLIIDLWNTVLLVRGKGLFATYPKRVFRDNEQINDFRSVATKNILEA
jgi:hypothetical protein